VRTNVFSQHSIYKDKRAENKEALWRSNLYPRST